ncbi:hypothetical protein Hanom_Chr03g00188091 [Helianthus anomalus]
MPTAATCSCTPATTTRSCMQKRVVPGDESQTPQYSKALFQSWFQNLDFRDELQNFLSSSYPTKIGSEDVDGEEADEDSDDDTYMI